MQNREQSTPKEVGPRGPPLYLCSRPFHCPSASGSPGGGRLARPDVLRAETRKGQRRVPPAGRAPGAPTPANRTPAPLRVPAALTATKPEEEAMNTRMTILSPRRDAPSAPSDSGLVRTRTQNSAAENRGCHRPERSLRVRSQGSRSLPPGLQIKSSAPPRLLPWQWRGRRGGGEGRCGA